MPSLWTIGFGELDARRVSLTALHAVTSFWLQDSDHHASSKSHSITPLHDLDGGVGLQIGLLNDAVGVHLQQAVKPGMQIRMDGQITSVTRGPTEVIRDEWEDISTDSGSRKWKLDFLTPTTFRHGARYSPWPDPITVVTGLRRRFDEFCSSARRAELSHLRRDYLWITDVRGTTECVTLRNRRIHGFVGSVTYALVPESPDGALVDSAMRLAPYSGVGAHTTHGLGVTQVKLL